MTQQERRIFLINALIDEKEEYKALTVPKTEAEQKMLLRALFNVREPKTADEEFLKIQSQYLKAETAAKGITDLSELEEVQKDIYLWQGDITTLKCDAIVNAANSALLGCFCPNHSCIDNAIHTFAGIELRLACSEIMKKQGHEEKTGKAKLTPAFNLPCKFVLHTVGPIVGGVLTKKHKAELESCYLSCLELAQKNKLQSIAFCCISTGEFHFPNNKAAEIAVQTVKQFKSETKSEMKVIFNVFKDQDLRLYERLLKRNSAA